MRYDDRTEIAPSQSSECTFIQFITFPPPLAKGDEILSLKNVYVRQKSKNKRIPDEWNPRKKISIDRRAVAENIQFSPRRMRPTPSSPLNFQSSQSDAFIFPTSINLPFRRRRPFRATN